MSVVVELDESNDSSGEVVHDGITQLNFGTADVYNQDIVANAVIPGANAMEKWLRLHFTSLGSASAIKGCKVWAAAPPTNITFFYNGHTVQATYDASKKTTFSTPATTTTRTPNSLPTSEPASANIGFAGSLTGQITAAGRSDYYLLQPRVGALATVGYTNLVYSFAFEAVA